MFYNLACLFITMDNHKITILFAGNGVFYF